MVQCDNYQCMLATYHRAVSNRTRYAVLFNGTPQLPCAHFLHQETYSSLEAISQSEASRNTFCCFGISQIIRSFPTPPPLSRFPALSPLCYTDNASEVKQLVVTGGHVLQAVESWVIKMQLILVTSTCYGLPYLPGTLQQRHTLRHSSNVASRMH